MAGDSDFFAVIPRVDPKTDLRSIDIDDRHRILADLQDLTNRQFELVFVHEISPCDV